MTSHQTPLVFIYDRCATQDTRELERRLKACAEYVSTYGWGFGGWWRDSGDYALTNDRRPAFDTLLRTMQAVGDCPRVCLVYDWDRLSRDVQARDLMTRHVLLLGAWVETCDGEKRTPSGKHRQVGRLTSGPVSP
ncbi:recombinase family protein [Streptantibioticus ferralitis]|uniref:Recombinase family protein n=1 Tax=Streptantibioticus ferralitis TaxID=236510 RepID=A0ABT5ZAP5_9ACTN|nr:recombinase family protein [Streptantibioticus ferralitis]MDF2260702.1 recombinase family protein [Streptantibioticus ferralitis]